MLDKHVASHTKPFSCGKPHACPTCLDTERFCYNGHMTNSLAGSVSHPESPSPPFPPLLPGPTGLPPPLPHRPHCQQHHQGLLLLRRRLILSYSALLCSALLCSALVRSVPLRSVPLLLLLLL